MNEHGAEFFERDRGPEHRIVSGGSGSGRGSELKIGLNEYLSKTPKDFPVRSLADVIAFNERNHDRELQYYGQENLINGEKNGVDPSDPKVQRRAREGAADGPREHRCGAREAPRRCRSSHRR